MSQFGPASRWLAGIAAVALGAVGAALVSQHVFEMLPCPWCALQRLIFLCIGVAALLGLAWASPTGRRVGATLVGLLALCGVAAALWQHFVAAASASCNATLADRILGLTGLDRLWPEVFAPYANCGDKVSLWGLPYEAFSFALFLALLAAATQARRAGRG